MRAYPEIQPWLCAMFGHTIAYDCSFENHSLKPNQVTVPRKPQSRAIFVEENFRHLPPPSPRCPHLPPFHRTSTSPNPQRMWNITTDKCRLFQPVLSPASFIITKTRFQHDRVISHFETQNRTRIPSALTCNSSPFQPPIQHSPVRAFASEPRELSFSHPCQVVNNFSSSEPPL